MAISKRTKNGNTYISYNYRDGSGHIWTYCGKEGARSTTVRLKVARMAHMEARLRRVKESLGK